MPTQTGARTGFALAPRARLSTVVALTLAPACGARSALTTGGAGRGGNYEAVDSGLPEPPAVCTDPTVNAEPGIFVAIDRTVRLTGQIRVWIVDESPPPIAPGELVDNTTGAITSPGDRSATAKDGWPYEPALYIAPQSPTNAGTPHFPQWVKGWYTNNPPKQTGIEIGAPVDPLPSSSVIDSGAPDCLCLQRKAEFAWDVTPLGLDPGAYLGVFAALDGDSDRAIRCVTITITQ